MIGDGGEAAEAEVLGDLGEGGRDAGLLLLPADEVEDLLLAAGECRHTVCSDGISPERSVNGELFTGTHSPRTALATVRHVDRIIVVAGGRVVESGTHDELQAIGGGVYRRLAALQFRE